jgi:hypothetical protein
LIVAGDVLLSDPLAQPIVVWLLAALDEQVRAEVQSTTFDQLDHMPLTIALIGVELLALDGGALCTPEGMRCAAMARDRGLPCYLLVPGGPDPRTASIAAQITDVGQRYLPPERISAIITDRALYRPAMVARYLGDHDTPLDLIPLTS